MAAAPGSQLGIFSHEARGVGAVLHSDWAQGMPPWRLKETPEEWSSQPPHHPTAQGLVPM